MLDLVRPPYMAHEIAVRILRHHRDDVYMAEAAARSLRWLLNSSKPLRRRASALRAGNVTPLSGERGSGGRPSAAESSVRVLVGAPYRVHDELLTAMVTHVKAHGLVLDVTEALENLTSLSAGS